MTLQKLGPEAVDNFDWDWFDRYAAEVEAEIAAIFSEAARAAGMDPVMADKLAQVFAQEKAAELLKLDGPMNLQRQTRERVRMLVAENLASGESLAQLKKRLREDFAFSSERAERVARTETSTALGQGERGAALAQGRDEKKWNTQGPDGITDETICLPNEAQGWIAAGDLFQSGHDTIPGHPNCRCRVRYRTAMLAIEGVRGGKAFEVIAEARCTDCGKLIAKEVIGGRLWCWRCKKEIVFGGPTNETLQVPTL